MKTGCQPVNPHAVYTKIGTPSDPELVKFLTPNKNDVPGSFLNWMRFVQGHYLGALVIDEVQNIFKLPTVKERKSKTGRDRAKLRLSDDETLKTLMNFIDISGVPLMLVGTPDAEAVLQKRFAVSQRLTTGGKITFRHPESCDSNEFVLMLKTLEKYQWSDVPLVISGELRKFIYSVTAGIRRLVIALWRASHKAAIASGSRNLTASHFKQAARTTLSHTQPAVDALLSGHPNSMRRFEDLMSLVKMDAEDW